MKNRLFALLLALSASYASAAGWTDWSSITTGASGSGVGTLTLGTSTVGVTLSGNVDSFVNGDYYYNNYATGFTSPTGTYGGLAPSDLIQEWNVGHVTLNFSEAVVNPLIALVSVGQGYSVGYQFSSPFSVLTSGPNYWGYIGYGVSGNTFNGYEYNGILKFTGTYTSLSFDIQQPEYWHGFNVGAESVAAIPEPETYAMLLAGLGVMGAVARRRRIAA